MDLRESRHMRTIKSWAAVVLLSSSVLGCAPIQPDIAPDAKSEQARQQEPIVIRVSGYGTYEEPRDRLMQRQRLMAMRASKLDAYRALVERVYGTSLSGSSTVQDMVLQDDRYRTMVDSVIRGARVVSVTELSGGGFETVLELVLEGRFRDCVTNVNYFKYSEECRMQLPLQGMGGDDLAGVPGMWRESSGSSASRALDGTPRTLDSAPDSIVGNRGGMRGNQYYHIGKDK